MVTLLIGDIGSGKTTLCLRLARAAQAQGLRVAGILTLPGPSGKEELWALDLESGERRPLAGRALRPGTERRGRYHFDEATFDWAMQAVRRGLAQRAALLIVDEIGPLELEQSLGFAPLLAELAQAPGLVVLSVRRSCCEALAERLAQPVSTVFVNDRHAHARVMAALAAHAAPFAFSNFQG